MDDIIDMGVDAKHSFEDKIMPVEEAYQRWSDRVGILVGVDMHLLTTGTEEQIRKRVREILDVYCIMENMCSGQATRRPTMCRSRITCWTF